MELQLPWKQLGTSYLQPPVRRRLKEVWRRRNAEEEEEELYIIVCRVGGRLKHKSRGSMWIHEYKPWLCLSLHRCFPLFLLLLVSSPRWWRVFTRRERTFISDEHPRESSVSWTVTLNLSVTVTGLSHLTRLSHPLLQNWHLQVREVYKISEPLMLQVSFYF